MLDMPEQQQHKLREEAAKIQRLAGINRLTETMDGEREVQRVGDAQVVQVGVITGW